MKKLTLTCLAMSFVIALSACQQGLNETDTAKIQESIDKIKAKIQDNLSGAKNHEEDKNSEKSSDSKESNSSD